MYCIIYSMKNQKFIKLALSLANTSEHYSTRVGAVLVHKNKTIIATGVNSNTKSHPLQKFYNSYRNFEVEINHHIHAEMDCIVKYKNMGIELEDLSLYIVRLNKTGNIVPAYPCVACAKALKEYGINNLIYSIDNDTYRRQYDCMYL